MCNKENYLIRYAVRSESGIPDFLPNEYWTKLGKCAEDNPDLPLFVIKEILIGVEQIEQGNGITYKFED